MIYRNWSLLSSTVVIWGSVATVGLAGIFLFGGKVTNRDRPKPQSSNTVTLSQSGLRYGVICA